MKVLIVGAGGHGAVVLDILRSAGQYEPAGFIDADPALTGRAIGGVPVLGPLNLLPKLRSQFGGAIVAIGDNRVRRGYAGKLQAAGVRLINAIHPSAVVSSTATLGQNVVMAAGAIVGTGAKVGHSALLNTGCIIDHECEIGEAAHVGPGVKLAGRVQVGSRALVGIGACVLPCLHVGDEATVGAGAVVLGDVERGTTVVGVPAQVVEPRRPLAAAS